jgi:hypothetical protein
MKVDRSGKGWALMGKPWSEWQGGAAMLQKGRIGVYTGDGKG